MSSTFLAEAADSLPCFHCEMWAGRGHSLRRTRKEASDARAVSVHDTHHGWKPRRAKRPEGRGLFTALKTAYRQRFLVRSVGRRLGDLAWRRVRASSKSRASGHHVAPQSPAMFAAQLRAVPRAFMSRLVLGAGSVAAGGAVTSSSLSACAHLYAHEMDTVPLAQLRATSLGLWQHTSNFVYEHPFKTILSIVAPSYGLLFAKESLSEATKDMLLSQRLIHTRVFGQAIAIAATVSVMAYVKHMEVDGGIYRIAPDDISVVRGYPTERLRHWYSEDNTSGQTLLSADRHVSKKGDLTNLLVPLLWIPFISSINLGLRGRVAPNRLTQLTLAAIGVGLAHASYAQLSDSSMGFDRK